MPKKTWAEVKPGDRVELNGKTWDVLRAKAKGKKVNVTVELNGREASSVVRGKDIVKVAKPGKLHGPDGGQTRWASKAELKKAMKTQPSKPASPPVKESGDVWETPRDRIEAKLDDLLSARLMAETPDESAGYYVPPVDVTTVASHLREFHGVDPSSWHDEGTMLKIHSESHRQGSTFEVSHWHSKTRPAKS